VFGLDLSFRGERLDPNAVTRILGVERSSTRLEVDGVSPGACVEALARRIGGWLPDLSTVPGVEEAWVLWRVGLRARPGRGSTGNRPCWCSSPGGGRP
jgi:hypothetical protein